MSIQRVWAIRRSLYRFSRLTMPHYRRCYSSQDQHISRDPKKEINSDKQNRTANLGSMVDSIRERIPNILHKSLPSEMLDNDVMLAICPISHPFIPLLKGQLSYFTACKTLQLIMNHFVLNSKTNLHIYKLEVFRPAGTGMSDEEIFDEHSRSFHDFQKSPQYGIFPMSTKVIVKWRTCDANCDHHQVKSGRDKSIDLSPLLFLNFSNTTTNGLIKMINSLANSTTEGHNAVHGVFIFELNSNHDAIKVHTIETLELIQQPDMNEAMLAR